MNTNTLVLLGVGAAALYFFTRPRAPGPVIAPSYNPVAAGNAAGYIPQPGGSTDPGDRNNWIGGLVGSIAGVTSSIIGAVTSQSGAYTSSGAFNGNSNFGGTDSNGYVSGGTDLSGSDFSDAPTGSGTDFNV